MTRYFVIVWYFASA